MQATLPVGEMKPVNANTSRSTGCGSAVGAVVGGAERVADALDWDALDWVVPDDALAGSGPGELAHAVRTSSAINPAIAEVERLPG
jgi:hypothetical protein